MAPFYSPPPVRNTGEGFKGYVKQVLCPNLRPGDVVTCHGGHCANLSRDQGNEIH